MKRETLMDRIAKLKPGEEIILPDSPRREFGRLVVRVPKENNDDPDHPR